jgi:hypothetical protein
MTTQFNDLLVATGIRPESVCVMRHHTPEPGVGGRTLADLWRDKPEDFKLYQETQKANRPIFRKRKIWASFVRPTSQETVFIGLFDAELVSTRTADWRCPYRGDTPGDGKPVDIFTTRLRPELSEQIGKLRVVWPPENVRNWRRKAEGLFLPLIADSFSAISNEPLVGLALLAGLEALGFAQRRSTKKLVQLRRGDLVVYVKRETKVRPLVVHPRFLDVAGELVALGGIEVAQPPRTYVNSNLGEFPHYVGDHRQSTGRHGFAIGVAPSRLAPLVELLDRRAKIETDQGEIRVIAPGDAPLTERERLQAARIGQGDFRNALIAAWGGACPVAGVDHLELLRASHIKPWKASGNAERLDPFNGLLLCAHVDALFDRGLISFEDDGRMLISSKVTPANLARLGMRTDQVLAGLDQRHAPYLAYHRDHCFIR